MIKERLVALASKFTKPSKADLQGIQAGPRAAQSHTLNYASVNTLDPSRLASAFAQADQGTVSEQAALFEMIEQQDTHIFSELAKRRRAVTGLGWSIVPPKDATQSELDRVGELTNMLASITGFETALYDLTDGIGKGFTALEQEWNFGSEWLPKHLHFVPQRLFQICRDDGEFKYLNMGMPEALRPYGWVIHQHKSLSGYIEQAALFRVLGWTYAYKAYNIKDMQRFLEVYGLPLRLGKYPTGIGAKQRDELLKAVRNIGSDGAGVVPSSMTIDFIEAQTGKVTDFLDAVAYWERKQSMAVLGGTLTSQADGKTSTNALGEIHNEVRREIMLDDVRQIEPTLNAQLIQPIVLFNGLFSADRLPKFKFDTEETIDQEKMVAVLAQAAAIGMEIDIEYAHKITQIPRAEEGKPILGNKPVTKDAKDAALVRLAALAKSGVPQDITDAYATQLAKLCANNETGLIQNMNALLGEHGDFESALAAMEQLAIASNTKDWAGKLAKGMAAANLAGRSDVVDGQ